MRLTLVVPALLDWSSSALAIVDASAPTLARWIARAGGPAIEPEGALAILCRLLGIARQRDGPIAPWIARAQGIDPGSAYWFCADPVHLSVDRDDVRLAAMIHDLEPKDAHSLTETLNAHFAPDGVEFVAPSASRWLAKVGTVPDMVTHPPQGALCKSVRELQPEGLDSPLWRRRQNEMQMLLFEHPVNLVREAHALAPINSVWLWGGGTYTASAMPAGDISLFGNAKIPRDVASGAGARSADLPPSFDALPDSAVNVVWLDMGDTGPDNAQGRDAVIRLESDWFAKIAGALARRVITELSLVIGGQAAALSYVVPAPTWRSRLDHWFGVPPLETLLAHRRLR